MNSQNALALQGLQNELRNILQEFRVHAKETAATNKSSSTYDTPYLAIQQNMITGEANETRRNRDRGQPIRETNEANDYHLLIGKLDELKILMGKVPYENHILHRLCFPSMLRRGEAIRDPVADTYSWILQTGNRAEEYTSLYSSEQILRRKTANKFISFLRNDGQTFFVTGRAGCGKSTLMKFLGHNNNVVTEALETWAGGRKLVVVGMYFWSSDDPLQKSLEGFYRSILYHTLKQCPELINLVFPSSICEGLFPDSTEYQMSDLKRAFSRLLELKNSKTYRFCYFLDGLDEYDGDPSEHRDLARQIVAWADSQAVKIVCSARPYTVFIDVFEPVGITVTFHHLTPSDIRNFAEHQFTALLDDQNLAEAKDTCLSIVEDITTRAEGVFLWAFLVVRSLINGALEHEEDECLRKRLQDCPNDLDGMFRKILDKIDPSPWNRQCSNAVLYLAIHNPFKEPLNALIYSWLPDINWLQRLDDTCEFPYKGEPKPLTEDEIEKRHQYVRRLLHRTTFGLLEMVKAGAAIPLFAYGVDYIPIFKYRVDFFHRSVRDFLRKEWTPIVLNNLPSSTVQDVEVYSRLCAAEAKLSLQLIKKDYLKSLPWYLHDLFQPTFTWLRTCERRDDCMLPSRCVQEFCKLPCPARSVNISRNQFIGYQDHDVDGSFIHYASHWSLSSYVRQCLANDSIVEDTEELSLLLTASFATDYDTTRLLLDQGHRPSRKVKFGKQDWASIWMVLLRLFAVDCKRYNEDVDSASEPYEGHVSWEKMQRYARILEAYLWAGADPTVYFVVGKSFFGDAFPQSYKARIDLYRMLETFSPPNLSTLRNLLNKQACWKYAARRPWSAVFSDDTYKHLPSITIDLVFSRHCRIDQVRSKYGDKLDGGFGIRLY